MLGALNTSLSGLVSATTRVGIAASNIANIDSVGTPPAAQQSAVATGSRPASPPLRSYKPLRAASTTTPDGGVRTTAQTVDPPTVRSYEPDNPAANDKGVVDRPNDDLAKNLVELRQAKQAYKANAAAIRAEDEMFGRLLDIKK